MIELLLSILIEFGLIREDYKHRKRIKKRELNNGKKRPFQKYLLQPSLIITMTTLAIVIVGTLLFTWYQKTYSYPEKTKKELAKMCHKIQQWKDKFGQYPSSIEELTGNSPMRHDWKKDAWGRPYNYVISKNGKSVVIISVGSDGTLGTEDDIKLDN